jgi:bifunctional non-homologous end joining protein LigD
MLPTRFVPQLATLADHAPTGDDWLHEIKVDGYRVGCRIDRGNVTLLTRQSLDWTDKFAQIARAAARVDVTTAFIDGEICVVGPDGRTSFNGLQQALSTGAATGLTYFAFDLLHLNGVDTAALPLEQRRALLSDLGSRLPEGIRVTDHVRGDGPGVLAAARELGLEGIVSKRLGMPYHPGRSSDWLKAKCLLRQEFVIGGFTDRAGARGSDKHEQDLGALLCGTYGDEGHLRFAGKVGTGFSARMLSDLRRQLDPLVSDACPFTPVPDALSRRGARWVQPTLVAEIEFRQWTDDGKMRHASFIGLRADKPARDVRRESPR